MMRAAALALVLLAVADAQATDVPLDTLMAWSQGCFDNAAQATRDPRYFFMTACYRAVAVPAASARTAARMAAACFPSFIAPPIAWILRPGFAKRRNDKAFFPTENRRNLACWRLVGFLRRLRGIRPYPSGPIRSARAHAGALGPLDAGCPHSNGPGTWPDIPQTHDAASSRRF